MVIYDMVLKSTAKDQSLLCWLLVISSFPKVRSAGDELAEFRTEGMSVGGKLIAYVCRTSCSSTCCSLQVVRSHSGYFWRSCPGAPVFSGDGQTSQNTHATNFPTLNFFYWILHCRSPLTKLEREESSPTNPMMRSILLGLLASSTKLFVFEQPFDFMKLSRTETIVRFVSRLWRAGGGNSHNSRKTCWPDTGQIRRTCTKYHK